MTEKIRILFLAANPLDTERLDLEEEAREIEKKLEAAQYRDNFEFISKWAIRPEDLQHNLLKYKPHIVHFSSHGSRSGEIVLKGADGKAKRVGKDALTGLFRTLRDNVRIVVLNACYSKEQAQAIVKVIGNRGE
jgi:CHAT domain-containing protein